MNKKVEVLKKAIELVEKKAGIEKIVALVNASYEMDELPVDEYRRYAHLLADLERMLEQEEVEAAFTEGQAVAVTGHKTVCYFVRYLPVVEWSKKSKPRCIVTFGKGGGEIQVFVEDISPVQRITEKHKDDVLVVSFNQKPLFELFKGIDGSYSWKCNISLEEHIKEELPAYYKDERAVQEMYKYLGRELC